MFKANGGFTLVELVVVIAILGILTSVAVPAYSTYVGKAKTEVTEYNQAIATRESQLASIAAEAGINVE